MIDVRAAPLALAQLERFFEAFGQVLVNTRSTTWRNLDEAERGKDAIGAVASAPNLDERPVIEPRRGVVSGLGQGWQAKLLG